VADRSRARRDVTFTVRTKVRPAREGRGPGGGRPPGSPNKTTLVIAAAMDAVAAKGVGNLDITPLELLGRRGCDHQHPDRFHHWRRPGQESPGREVTGVSSMINELEPKRLALRALRRAKLGPGHAFLMAIAPAIERGRVRTI
jgi:hypothetical protein